MSSVRPGRDRSRRCILRVAATLWLGAAAFVAQAAESTSEMFGLNELTQLLRRDAPATANFHELQYRHILKEPLERRGELHFEPPALFEKRVHVPVSETYRIDGETLSIALPDRKARQISLRNQPLLGGLLLGFQAIISGKLATLSPRFEVEVSGNAAGWRLDLKPTEAEIVRYIDAIHVTGRGSEPLRFEVLEHNGDRTVTDIEP